MNVKKYENKNRTVGDTEKINDENDAFCLLL